MQRETRASCYIEISTCEIIRRSSRPSRYIQTKPMSRRLRRRRRRPRARQRLCRSGCWYAVGPTSSRRRPSQPWLLQFSCHGRACMRLSSKHVSSVNRPQLLLFHKSPSSAFIRRPVTPSAMAFVETQQILAFRTATSAGQQRGGFFT